jgi:hypothetical protein
MGHLLSADIDSPYNVKGGATILERKVLKLQKGQSRELDRELDERKELTERLMQAIGMSEEIA